MDLTITGAGTYWYLAETVFPAERSGTWKGDLALTAKARFQAHVSAHCRLPARCKTCEEARERPEPPRARGFGYRISASIGAMSDREAPDDAEGGNARKEIPARLHDLEPGVVLRR